MISIVAIEIQLFLLPTSKTEIFPYYSFEIDKSHIKVFVFSKTPTLTNALHYIFWQEKNMERRLYVKSICTLKITFISGC